MAAQRRSSRIITRQSQRRGTNWGRLVATLETSVAASAKVLLASFTLSNVGIGETIRRTRVTFLVLSDQSAAVELQIGAFGMIVVNDLALAAGAASIPGPETDANDDGWFVWEPFLQVGEAAVGGAASSAEAVKGYTFDSKAMRRVEEGFSIAVMIENASASHGFEALTSISLLSSMHS